MDDEIPVDISRCFLLRQIHFSVVFFSPPDRCPPPSPQPSPPPSVLLQDLHHAAFALQSLSAGLLPGALAVNVEAHVPLLVQVEELLKELRDVVVGLGRRLHEGALPLVGLGFPVLGLHLPVGFVALVSHKHDGDGLHIAFYGQNLQRAGKASREVAHFVK